MLSTPTEVKTVEFKRVQLNLSPVMYAMVEEIAKAHDLNITDACRRAMSLLKIVYDVIDGGGRILIDQDGITREVKLL
jgi:hypothetical protein